MRRLIAGLMLCVASVGRAEAQWVVNPWWVESSVSLSPTASATPLGDYTVMLTIDFRNTAGYSPGTLYGITGVSFGLLSEWMIPCAFGDRCWVGYGSPAVVGAIDFRGAPGSAGIGSALGDWGYSDSSPISQTHGPIAVSSNNPGLVGCSVPTIDLLSELRENITMFSGRTCLADGYDGFLRITAPIVFHEQSLYEQFRADDVYLHFWGRQYMYPIPEPSTSALIAIGLVALAMARRRLTKWAAGGDRGRYRSR